VNEFDDPINAYTASMANYSGGANAVQQAHQQQQQQQHYQAIGQVAQLPTGGIRTAFHTGAPIAAPVTKKPKLEGMISNDHHMQAAAMQQQLQQVAAAAGMQQQQQIMGGVADSGGVSLPVGHGIRLGGVGGVSPATTQAATRVPGVQVQQFMWGAGMGGGGGPSEKAVAERRQRNREHAKRSRVRKKFMLESLQGEVLDLQRENQRLRMLVQEHISDNPQQIISECCSTNPLFADTGMLMTGEGDQKTKAETLVKADYTLMQSLTMGQQCFVLSDPKLPDNPIVFASPGFYKLTGYTSKEVLGRNCRFLQGPGTNPKAVEILKKNIAAGTDSTVCILNYKSDGTPFWNQLFVAALRDSDNCIVNYVSLLLGNSDLAQLRRKCCSFILTPHFPSACFAPSFLGRRSNGSGTRRWRECARGPR